MIEYFITKGYLGKRLFRWNRTTGEVYQIVVKPPPVKKGRPNMYGIYLVKESTLRGQYLWHLDRDKKLILRTTEKLWNYYANQVFTKIMAGNELL